MFDFLDADWFIIGLEIVFLSFITYDAWKYYKTKKREYIVNIVLALGFAFWVLYPFYTKYYRWDDKDREALTQACLGEHNSTYCSCIDNMIFKTYDMQSFKLLHKRTDKDFLEFLEESEKECFESSWF